jgi:hypothetical protein
MPSPRAVLLTPPVSVHPHQLPFCQQSAPVNPLEATLTASLASAANKRLTKEVSPVDATLTENRGARYPSSLCPLPVLSVSALSFSGLALVRPQKEKGRGPQPPAAPPCLDSLELCWNFGLTTRGLSNRLWPASPRSWPAPWHPHPASAFSASWSGSAPCRQSCPCSRTDPRWFARP